LRHLSLFSFCFFIFYSLLLLSPLSAETDSIPSSYIIVNFKTGRVCEIQDSLGLLDHPFPPGSVIKIFSTLAYLYSGGDSKKVLLCKETESGDPIPPACWYRPGHGHLDLTGALAQSCDTYFSKIFTSIRYNSLMSILESSDLLDEEIMENIYQLSSSEKRKTWIGIGKHLRMKPIDLFLSVNGIAGDGKFYRRSDSLLIFKKKSHYNDDFIEVIKEGMREGSITGTTKIAQEILGMQPVFGKTGTATYFYNEEDYRKTHGYYLGFYPFPYPEYGILVFLLEGDGRTAVEKGAHLLKDYLEQKEEGN
jgi:cell division protein FtsI/penicillin-binding protein 2